MSQFTEDELLDREIDAEIIQRFWRQNRLRRALRQISKSFRESLYYYYSPVNINMKANSALLKLQTLLKNKKLKHYKFDLCDNPLTKSWVKQLQLNQEPLPYIFLNNLFIGSMDELQILVDHKYLEQILRKDYLDHCLICNQHRDSLNTEKCQHCQFRYTFFEKQNNGVLVCPKCREKLNPENSFCEKCQQDGIKVNESLINFNTIQ